MLYKSNFASEKPVDKFLDKLEKKNPYELAKIRSSLKTIRIQGIDRSIETGDVEIFKHKNANMAEIRIISKGQQKYRIYGAIRNNTFYAVHITLKKNRARNDIKLAEQRIKNL